MTVTFDFSPTHDFFDHKASVISSFLSSVVIALVGLAITSSIQKAQLKSSEENAKAQIEAVRLKDQSDERIQQSKLEADLFDHLFSNDPLHRALALNMLHRAVPSDFHEQTVLMFAAKDTDPSVSSAAIKQLSVSTDPAVLKVILAIANDPGRPPSVRAEAALASRALAFTTSLSTGTIVMYATRVGRQAYVSNTQGSLFTQALLEGLDASTSSTPKGGVNLQQLFDYVQSKVPALARESGREQFPSLQVSGYRALDEPLFGQGSSTVAVVVGISQYQDPNMATLEFSDAAATRIAEYFKRRGAKQVFLLTGQKATRTNILSTINRLSGAADQNADVLFYFGGHGWSIQGKAYFATFDTKLSGDIDLLNITALSTQEVMSMLGRVEGRRKILFLDMSTNDPTTSR